MPNVYQLITKPSCPRCPIARRWLLKNEMPYEELVLDTPEAIAAFKEAYPTIKSVPVIFNPDGTLFLSWEASE